MKCKMITYTLTYSKRKTIGIYIRNGMVEVRAPLNCPKSEINKLISSKEKWIHDNLAISQRQAESKDTFELDYGSKILFRGELFPIIAKPGTQAGFDGRQFYMPPNLPPAQIKEICIKTYQRLAKTRITNIVVEIAAHMGVTPTSVKINSAKTRWGSCSSRKSLNFSWRLVMAADDVIDYVVVHELAHIFEMNHSAKFWTIVEKVLPDYKQRQKKLNELQKRLATESW